MPKLTITYGDTVAYDAEVDSFTWEDTPGGGAVKWRAVSPHVARPPSSGLAELLGQLGGRAGRRRPAGAASGAAEDSYVGGRPDPTHNGLSSPAADETDDIPMQQLGDD